MYISHPNELIIIRHYINFIGKHESIKFQKKYLQGSEISIPEFRNTPKFISVRCRMKKKLVCRFINLRNLLKDSGNLFVKTNF